MDTIHLDNPNKKLVVYGICLVGLFLLCLTFEKFTGILIGTGIIVRLLVLLWMPRAADSVGRNPLGWTLFALLDPSIALIVLGSVGYKKNQHFHSIIKLYNQKLSEKQAELTLMAGENKISAEEKDLEMANFYEELIIQARKQLAKKYSEADEKFLNEQLERHGYVMDPGSDVFVPVSDKCPACGETVSEKDETCPGCGLALK
ncbi:MAG: hypothetical protein JXB34_03750 [Bacteroidales bacterium]|nr:hypothetical protein [Bacteroidales bacterium]